MKLFKVNVLKSVTHQPIFTTYRKTGTRDPSGTLAGPYKNRKTRTRDPRKIRKPGPETLEKPEKRDLSGTLRKVKKWDTVP